VVKNGPSFSQALSVVAQITGYNLKCHKCFAILTMLMPMDRIVVVTRVGDGRNTRQGWRCRYCQRQRVIVRVSNATCVAKGEKEIL
jgi:hypothetical protein